MTTLKRIAVLLVLAWLAGSAQADELMLISGSRLIEAPLEFYVQATSTSNITEYQVYLACETPATGYVTLDDAIIGRFSNAEETYINKDLPESGTYRLGLTLEGSATCNTFSIGSHYYQFSEALPPAAAAAPSQPAAADTGCTPVRGTIAGAFTGETTVLGTVTGDLRGAVSATVLETSENPDGTVALGLEHAFLTEMGDLLRTEDEAVLTPVSEGVTMMSTRYRITGGTGRFEGASGTLENGGVIDASRGLLTLWYRGEVCSREG